MYYFLQIKMRHPSQNFYAQHVGKERQHTIERDKDNIKDQTQIWTDADQTKVSAQHQPCEHTTRMERMTTQTIGRDKDNINKCDAWHHVFCITGILLCIVMIGCVFIPVMYTLSSSPFVLCIGG